MAVLPGPTRQRVAVGCSACGTVAYVYLTVHTLAHTRSCVHLRVVPDADDLVMLQLFGGAHRGPIVRVG